MTLDKAINDTLLAALFDGKTLNEKEMKLISLPTRLGDLGKRIQSEISVTQYEFYVVMTMQYKDSYHPPERKFSCKQ